MHSSGKGGCGQKEKQMYNNETATNNITKNTIYLFTHLLFTASPKISLSSKPKRKSILN